MYLFCDAARPPCLQSNLLLIGWPLQTEGWTAGGWGVGACSQRCLMRWLVISALYDITQRHGKKLIKNCLKRSRLKPEFLLWYFAHVSYEQCNRSTLKMIFKVIWATSFELVLIETNHSAFCDEKAIQCSTHSQHQLNSPNPVQDECARRQKQERQGQKERKNRSPCQRATKIICFNKHFKNGSFH